MMPRGRWGGSCSREPAPGVRQTPAGRNPGRSVLLPPLRRTPCRPRVLRAGMRPRYVRLGLGYVRVGEALPTSLTLVLDIESKM